MLIWKIYFFDLNIGDLNGVLTQFLSNAGLPSPEELSNEDFITLALCLAEAFDIEIPPMN
jgi:hypothetical protein